MVAHLVKKFAALANYVFYYYADSSPTVKHSVALYSSPHTYALFLTHFE
jgi:hypothetical protein